MRCQTRSWRRSAAIVTTTAAIVLSMHAGGAGGSHSDPFAFFNRLVVLEDADWQRLDGGEVAVRVLPSTDSHLGVFAALRLDAPADALVDWVREIEAFKQSAFVVAVRRFSDPPALDDLLLFARPPQPKPAPVDVSPLLLTTAELLSSDPALSGVRIDVEGSAPPLAADAELLKIVFLNLLVNSAHAMRGEGRIQVSIGVADGSCHVAVADAGPGIPPDIREKIFTPFFTTKSRGTGLGLPTAKRLIEAHHGAIQIDCPPGGGTIVIVQLPLATARSGGPVLESTQAGTIP